MNTEKITKIILNLNTAAIFLLWSKNLTLSRKLDEKTNQIKSLTERLERCRHISKGKSEILDDLSLENAELRNKLGDSFDGSKTTLSLYESNAPELSKVAEEGRVCNIYLLSHVAFS